MCVKEGFKGKRLNKVSSWLVREWRSRSRVSRVFICVGDDKEIMRLKGRQGVEDLWGPFSNHKKWNCIPCLRQRTLKMIPCHPWRSLYRKYMRVPPSPPWQWPRGCEQCSTDISCSQAMESFAWNIRVLKGQADLLLSARRECQDYLRQVSRSVARLLSAQSRPFWNLPSNMVAMTSHQETSAILKTYPSNMATMTSHQHQSVWVLPSSFCCQLHEAAVASGLVNSVGSNLWGNNAIRFDESNRSDIIDTSAGRVGPKAIQRGTGNEAGIASRFPRTQFFPFPLPAIAREKETRGENSRSLGMGRTERKMRLVNEQCWLQRNEYEKGDEMRSFCIQFVNSNLPVITVKSYRYLRSNHVTEWPVCAGVRVGFWELGLDTGYLTGPW